jgi:hypothetical protein
MRTYCTDIQAGVGQRSILDSLDLLCSRSRLDNGITCVLYLAYLPVPLGLNIASNKPGSFYSFAIPSTYCEASSFSQMLAIQRQDRHRRKVAGEADVVLPRPLLLVVPGVRDINANPRTVALVVAPVSEPTLWGFGRRISEDFWTGSPSEKRRSTVERQ